MTWGPDLRQQIEADAREAARLKGASSKDDVPAVDVGPRQEQSVRVRRRIVSAREA